NAKAEELEFRHEDGRTFYHVKYTDGRVGSWQDAGLAGNEPAEVTLAKKKQLERKHGINTDPAPYY
ncbi:MAG: hypothetical protein GY861_22905, partial [bacterium]|nr:hypothetical protein [bacterium]